MKNVHLLLVFLALLISSACGADRAQNPLAGNWTEVRSGDAPAMTLSFDADSDKMLVHGRPQVDGTHSHAAGTYVVDTNTGTVTVTGRILDGVDQEIWTGTVTAEGLELAGADTKLSFRKGSDPHGH